MEKGSDKTKQQNVYFRAGRDRAMLALISCSLVFVFTLACVCWCLLEQPSERTPERGVLTFHLFTVFSNFVAAIGAGLSIPFATEGVRKYRYHVPTWALMVMYMGTCAVSITIIFAVALIFPFKGADLAFGGTNFFLHLLCPALNILLFLFLESEHKLKPRHVWIALIPFFCYAVVYIIEVGIIGEGNGGWRDVYQLNTKLPFAVTIPIMLTLGWFVAHQLRWMHNTIAEKRGKAMAKKVIGVAEIPEGYAVETALDSLAAFAVSRSDRHEIVIPIDLIGAVKGRIGSEKSLRELCLYYADRYMDEREKQLPSVHKTGSRKQ